MRDRAVVGIAQWLPRPGDAAGNLATALGLIAELGGRRCDLIVLPELWPSGYSPKTLAGDVAASAEPLDGPRTGALARAASAAGAWLAAGSVPERDGTDVYNTALLFGRDGELRGVHRKAHLYAPAEGWWDGLYPARALENGQWWVMSNQCGRTPSGALLGGSQVISPLGRVVSRAVKVHELADAGGPVLLVTEIALREELAEADRLNAALWENRREELYTRADAWAGDNT